VIEYSEAGFVESALNGSLGELPNHAFIQRGQARSLLIFLNEFNTTVGEALRRLPRQLAEVEKKLNPAASLASIEVAIPGHSRPEDLVSLSDVAKLLQVSRQRAQQLSKQPDFPRPKGTPGTGPVYLLADVEGYLAERKRRLGERGVKP
jgi:predicted DNA-binding transcriptional regulator AlpA